MRKTIINKHNWSLIFDINEANIQNDIAFLNALWQYVLKSRNISRMVPTCKICHQHGEFTFEGFGGIKKIGDGVMFIPIGNKEMYITSDIVFHYFYIHGLAPTQKFREAVLFGAKPQSEEYAKMVKRYYKNRIPIVDKSLKCPYCGKKFKGDIGFAKGNEGDVVIHHNTLNYLRSEPEWMMICYKCLHCFEMQEY